MKTQKPINVAVALQWGGENNTAPRVTAKGRGEIAVQIAALAQLHDVPLNEDPALVELLAQVDVGAQIPEQVFTAVAEVIAFAYSLKVELPGHVSDRLRRV